MIAADRYGAVATADAGSHPNRVWLRLQPRLSHSIITHWLQLPTDKNKTKQNNQKKNKSYPETFDD